MAKKRKSKKGKMLMLLGAGVALFFLKDKLFGPKTEAPMPGPTDTVL